MQGITLRTQGKKNFIAASRRSRRLSRPSRDPLRNGPPGAKEATPDTRRWKHNKHAMKVAAAGGAVLDAAARRETNAAKQEPTLTQPRCSQREAQSAPKQ